MASADSQPTGRAVRVLEGVVLVVAALYFGRPVLVPLALALLFSFLLTQPVTVLERRGLPRVAAVGVIVCLIACLLAAVTWKTVDQLSELVLNLPQYKENLRGKIESLRGSGSSVIKTLERTVSEVSDELKRTGKTAQEAAATTSQPPQSAPTPVTVVSEPSRPWALVQTTVAALAEPLAQAGIVVVLVIFMLMGREDLRNRFVRLAGTGRITLTTKTLDEIETRISRYLLMNALVNSGFGLTIGTGLYLLGVDYAVLWGCLAAALRFVPYLGPIVASAMPISMSVIQSPDWTQPLLTLGLFIVAELITNNVVEPLTYGRSSGVSTVALLTAAVFWSWVWGPVGLLLSVPLTVVLVVLGKYVPPLEPLWILLGDEPPLPPHVQLYQRLLAGDADEAADVVDDFSTARSPVEIYDELLIPALVMAERDRGRGQLTEANQQFLWSTTQQLLDNYLELADTEAADDQATVTRPTVIVGLPATDRSDELALEMLAHCLPEHVELHRIGQSALASEAIELVAKLQPSAVVVSALGPGGANQVRYLCKRLRQRFADLNLVAARWGYPGDTAKMRAALHARGAGRIVTTLAEAVDAANRLPRLPDAKAGDEPAATAGARAAQLPVAGS